MISLESKDNIPMRYRKEEQINIMHYLYSQDVIWSITNITWGLHPVSINGHQWSNLFCSGYYKLLK